MLIEVQVIRTAQRVAYVDHLTGTGVLLIPDPWQNLDGEWNVTTVEGIEARKDRAADPLTMAALERSDAQAMASKLEAAGWRLRDAADPDYQVGHAGDFVALALDGERRVIECPSLDQLQEAVEAIYSAAGVEGVEL